MATRSLRKTSDSTDLMRTSRATGKWYVTEGRMYLRSDGCSPFVYKERVSVCTLPALVKVFAQPRQEMVEVGGPRFQKADEKTMRRVGIGHDLPAIHSQKGVGSEKSHAFVAVHERVIHQERLEQSRRHFGKVGVVTAAR